MSHAENAAFLVVGTLLAAGAIVVLASNPRSTPNRFFAAFLSLVAANFVLDWSSRAFATGEAFPSRFAVAARALVPFDAAALLYFAAIYPRRSRAARWLPAPLLVALALHTAYALRDPLASARGDPIVVRYATFAFFHACYLGALALTVRSLLVAEFASGREAARALVAGLLVVVAPRAGLVTVDLTGSRLSDLTTVLVRIAIASLVVAVTLLALRAERPEERARTRPWILAALVFVGLVFASWLAAVPLQGASADTTRAFALLFTLRWVFFAGLVGFALTRHAFLDIDRRVWRSARRGAPLVAAVAAFAVLWLAFRVEGHGAGAREPLALAGALLAGVGVAVVAGVGTPPDPLHERKLAAYRALVETDLEAGRDARGDELAAHRRRLAIAPRQHDDVVALVLAERALRDARGPRGSLPAGFRAVEVFEAGPTSWTLLAERAGAPGRVVVKALRPEWRANERVRSAFEREGAILASIQHQNVVRVVEVRDDPTALVLEYASGGSLAARVARDGPLPARELDRLARDVLAGLAELHRRGVVHRDVKPENVLFAEDGRAMVADLGSALLEPPAAGSTRVRVTAHGDVGTVLYMAPEQVRGGAVDARADLHAFGATVVFAATGRHYLRAEGWGEFDAKRAILDAPREVPGSLGAPLRSLVARCLDPEPARRPRDADDALACLA